MMVFWKDNGNASKSTWNIEYGNQFSVSIALQKYNGYEINAQTYIQQMSKAIATTKWMHNGFTWYMYVQRAQ